MMFNTAWDAIVNAGSGLALLLLGGWVATLRPRMAGTVSLAAFSSAFGLFMLVWNLRRPESTVTDLFAYQVFIGALTLVVVGALLAVAYLLPRKLGATESRWLVAFSGVGAVFASTLQTDGLGVEARASLFVMGALYATLATFALRHRRSDDPGERRQLVLMSMALVLYPAVFVSQLLRFGEPWASAGDAFRLGLHLLIVGSWLVRLPRAPPDEASGIRNLVLVGLAIPVAAALFDTAFEPRYDAVAGGPLWGLSRLATVAVLAYAILRHDILGLDVKVRFAISKSTVAAVFIAVFFVASEAAQQFFGERSGSQYLGIVAAGALVFAITPLSRLADRIATKAVPATTGNGEREAGSGDERTYRLALRRFLADGRVSREEEVALAELATGLGISHVRAVELRHEVEDAGVGGSTRPGGSE
ncbi:MAG: hypothetical protein ACT4PT_10435 [Methanobacteriota archaeon]